MNKIIETCPTCKELLVFPRGEECYCEDCGWPESDEGGEFGYPKEGEQLSNFQPSLEFFDGKKWLKSGVVSAIMRNDSFRGLYRYREQSHNK